METPPPPPWYEPETPVAARDPDRVPEWARDEAWASEMEYVWRNRMAPTVRKLFDRAKRLQREAEELEQWSGTERDGVSQSSRMLRVRLHVDVPCASGVQRKAETRATLKSMHDDGRSIVVDGDHGAASLRARIVELRRAAEWCEERARAASMTRRDAVSVCRGRFRTVACGCKRVEMLVGCDQAQLCSWCRQRHWRKWRRRIVRSMDAHLRVARDEWRKLGCRGAMPGVYLITLTVPHSGDLGTDRKVIGDGWRELSKAASYGGYERNGAHVEAKWWGAHALVYEVTAGTDDKGHMHAHVAVISQWVPYEELHAAWRDAVDGARVLDVVDPATNARKRREHKRKADDAATAAEYLAKYVTKGVQPSELTGRKAGEMLAAFYGKRKVTTSRGFWRPLAARAACCPDCGHSHRLVGAPPGLQQHAPHAVLSSEYARSRWWEPSGVTQTLLGIGNTRAVVGKLHRV